MHAGILTSRLVNVMHAILFLQTGHKKIGFVPNFGEIFVCLFLLFLFNYLIIYFYLCILFFSNTHMAQSHHLKTNN